MTNKTIDQRLDDIMTVLTGGHDSSGVYYPGLSPRMLTLEKKVDHIEKESEKTNENRLTLSRGITIATFGGVITQTLSWLKDHLSK